ncbi:hypothetical protein Taro_011262 [Colocasia esculenta]|uniref:phosphoribosylaminoimidazole carboxylase n=1 Tax=Colocasia esculenta TaxID=4460 RepID=A0A843UAE8_COLES|nr:hypothetical protein [Colocasia esculenta]
MVQISLTKSLPQHPKDYRISENSGHDTIRPSRTETVPRAARSGAPKSPPLQTELRLRRRGKLTGRRHRCMMLLRCYAPAAALCCSARTHDRQSPSAAASYAFCPASLSSSLCTRKEEIATSPFVQKRRVAMRSSFRSEHRDGGVSPDGKDEPLVRGISNTIVGVLGGGQLGRMLCQAASEMAIKVMTLDPLVNCPASALSFHHVVGSFGDGDAVREFAKRCGVVTVEIEHVDAVTLEKLEEQGVDCQPKASTIRIIQVIARDYRNGEPGFHLAHQLMSRALVIPGASVHWYDKPVCRLSYLLVLIAHLGPVDMRRSRKMGHITIVGPSMRKVRSHLNTMLNKENSRDQNHQITDSTARVTIIMGSDSDLPIMKDAAEVLKAFHVPFEITIVSAHRTPERMYSFALSAKDRGIRAIIAGAGGAAHLPGMVASLTTLPVIGVPVKTAAMNGVDSLLSIVQMPKGVPVATVAIGNAANAALLAIKILAVGDSSLWDRLSKYQEDMKESVLTKAEKLEGEGWERYLSS